MKRKERAASDFKKRIRESGLSIYDEITVGDPQLWMTSSELQFLLTRGLTGTSLKDLPLRTRSKVVKKLVCQSLGYPVPQSFRKTKPRFPGQCFDTYVQKSNNLQIWNEELFPTRRYVLIRISKKNVITTVRVVDGETLSLLDSTGTLTQKYQARAGEMLREHEMFSPKDTALLRTVITTPEAKLDRKDSPTDRAGAGISDTHTGTYK